MTSEIAGRADFSRLRYAQCWEDADVLLDGLDVQPGDTCLTVASAGDNTLSLLTRDPARVVAVDLSPAQLAALELRVAAYRELSHGELLELTGSRPSTRREALFARCRPRMSERARLFWDSQPAGIAQGVGAAGRFERYLATFRQWVLPLVHTGATSGRLLLPATREERVRFYDERWNTFSWRALFRTFFSERVMGWLGRDPSFFRYAERSVAEHLLERVRHALTVLDPSANPYLSWILTGSHSDALPHALRAENFELIRDRLDRLEWHEAAIEDLLASRRLPVIDRMNLSNVFEYIAPARFRTLLDGLADAARSGSRMLYWNMIVPRRGADVVPHRLRELGDLSAQLFARDKVFFYSALRVEEVR
jgi:S-adenosylmethionine-diacylglycerol 3-amino-3-carboxypropyl transferase